MNLRQVHTATKMQTGFIGFTCIDRLSQFLTRSEDN